VRTRRILSGCDGRTTPTTETTRTRMVFFARRVFFLFSPSRPEVTSGARGESARCPRTVTLPAESAAGPGGATPSRGRSGPLTRRRPPRRDPARPSEKHSPTRGGSLERKSRAARRRGAAGKIPAFERERARFGSGFGFEFDARWNRPTRRETKADRETRHPKRRRRRSQTRGETRDGPSFNILSRVRKYDTFVTRVKRDARVRPRLARVGDAFEPAPRNATARITFTRNPNRNQPQPAE